MTGGEYTPMYLVGREDLEEVRKRLRECREGAILIETSFARLDPGLIAVACRGHCGSIGSVRHQP